ncbi:hypothetical protein [Spartinivicinus poritis]|uniref:Uncharacterized protein n=1 Tax=Spartinivicinus poritis TaxID=2994640 RepID=A0ABT5UCN5_9GAMM|nr:hypothetical protein [Spartinivicinus sp. A2-2]MDE1464140.1 hypothetical protein [Spartinivicinus sp. A2-2]
MKEQILDKIDFGNGKLVFDEISSLEIVDNIAIYKNELKEDMLQVEYPNEVLIDVGWYPSFDIEGGFQVRVIKDYNWEMPLLIREARDFKKLVLTIKEAINIAVAHSN